MSLVSGCNPTVATSAGVRFDGTAVDQNLLGKAYIYENSPIVATGNPLLGPNVNMASFLSAQAQQITPVSKTSLTNDCKIPVSLYYVSAPVSYPFTDCLQVLESETAGLSPIQPNNGNWNFPANSSQFYQVNAMYHANKVVARMLDTMGFIHQNLHTQNFVKSLPPAVPYALAEMGTWWFKYLTGTSQMTKSARLTVQSRGNVTDNAFYDPITNQVVLGYLSQYPDKVLMVQDPSVIYHEMGHVFMTLFLNMRNAEKVAGVWRPLPYQAFPYYGAYDELSAMGEGVADYFSYAMTGRTTFGEWGLGRFLASSRPITEDNPMHAPGISDAIDERLSYPDLMAYYPQDPSQLVHGVHNTGMITSHYLVALTNTLKQECFMDQDIAVKHVMLLIAETLAYLGDLTGKGSDYNGTVKSLVNLSKSGAYEWYYGTRRINMRRFYQTFARNVYHHMTLNACPNLTKEKSEQLLDMYGLLLFRHYDDNGTFSDSSSAQATRRDSFVMSSGAGGLKLAQLPGFSALDNSTKWGFNYPLLADFSFPFTTAPTAVDEANRTKTLLVPKSMLEVKTTGAYSTLLLDDTQAFGNTIATNTLFEGRVISPSVGLAGAQYNNNNLKISPGEIAGLVLNLENRGNTAIAGVSILATPWAHMEVQTDAGTGQPSWLSKPCSINGFPSTSEGGKACTDAVLPENGNRFKRLSTGHYPPKALHPVCLVQKSSTNETLWISQDEFRRTVMQLPDNKCLGFGTPDFVPSECLMRFLPGKDSAFLSKIDPLKSYSQTVNPNGDEDTLESAFLALEVNKWITPGTMFTCRLRAQFTNCSDCFQPAATEDDYTDIEYGGHKPFKVIDLPITILD
jgi:hypothetical protein